MSARFSAVILSSNLTILLFIDLNLFTSLSSFSICSLTLAYWVSIFSASSLHIFMIDSALSISAALASAAAFFFVGFSVASVTINPPPRRRLRTSDMISNTPIVNVN
ncbi:hypothetical protein SAMN05216364_100618 [Porphyromonadaceae bacterium KHP3R9]|nr:hypothetical protein SAMN05216364_100618 [Porphyromonadaceae bacterium KHP3R9]